MSLGLYLGNEAATLSLQKRIPRMIMIRSGVHLSGRWLTGFTGLRSGPSQLSAHLCLPRLSTLYCTLRRNISHSSCRRSVTVPSLPRPTPPHWRRPLVVPRPITRRTTTPTAPPRLVCLAHPSHGVHHAITTPVPLGGGRRRSGHRLLRPVEDTATGRGACVWVYTGPLFSTSP